MTVGDYGRTTHKETSRCIKYTFIESQSLDMTALPVTGTPSITYRIMVFRNLGNTASKQLGGLDSMY